MAKLKLKVEIETRFRDFYVGKWMIIAVVGRFLVPGMT